MTETEKVLSYIRNNRSITSYEAYQHLGITQLGRVLSDLEKKGYEIDRDNWEQRNDKRYKRYELVEKGQQSMFPDHETRIPNHKREVEGRV